MHTHWLDQSWWQQREIREKNPSDLICLEGATVQLPDWLGRQFHAPPQHCMSEGGFEILLFSGRFKIIYRFWMEYLQLAHAQVLTIRQLYYHWYRCILYIFIYTSIITVVCTGKTYLWTEVLDDSYRTKNQEIGVFSLNSERKRQRSINSNNYK